MSRSLWYRLAAPLLELSLESNAATPDRKRWGVRLDGDVLTITLFDPHEKPVGSIEIHRSGVDSVDMVFPEACSCSISEDESAQIQLRKLDS